MKMSFLFLVDSALQKDADNIPPKKLTAILLRREECILYFIVFSPWNRYFCKTRHGNPPKCYVLHIFQIYQIRTVRSVKKRIRGKLLYKLIHAAGAFQYFSRIQVKYKGAMNDFAIFQGFYIYTGDSTLTSQNEAGLRILFTG